MVVDADNGIDILLAKGTHEVVGTLLHLGVGTLNGIQFDTIAVTACIYRRYRTSAKTDTIVVTTHYNNFVALLWLFLQTVALGAISHTTGKHDNLVVGIAGVALLLMLEGEHRTADKRLAELVAEVAGSVGSLDKYLLRCLIQPLAHG